ncbi:unnamed protein product [Paramecium octaurelia]|uniref:PIH1D1/2/3 CS-like domain-containing protein n=1 Tax=Paramecium octaurelia TaxID=43137 RepID=A0A8S1WXI2_PAROT|nr:unnamed protein product [Paramecium octaurelia]
MDQSQAQHIWKMLDDMAASDPQAYKQFVEKNIQAGMEEMKTEKQQKIEELSIVPQFAYSMKIWGNLLKQSINELESKLLLKQNELKQENFQFDKLEKRTKFYINLLHHDRVMGAFDKNDNPTDIPSQYNLIPLSISDVQIGKSASFNTQVYYYDIVINTDVFKKINRQILQSIIIDTLQKRIEGDKNPAKFTFFKAHYKFEIPSLKIINKQYKYCGPKKQLKLLLEPQADKEGRRFPKTQNPVENKIEQNLSFTRQQGPLDNLILNAQNQTQQGPQKKVLIEEIDTKNEVEKYQVVHEKDKIIITINVNVENFQDIDLNISSKGLKLTTVMNEKIELDFGCLVDDEHPSAKWNKKQKQLKIVVNKIL